MYCIVDWLMFFKGYDLSKTAHVQCWLPNIRIPEILLMKGVILKVMLSSSLCILFTDSSIQLEKVQDTRCLGGLSLLAR